MSRARKYFRRTVVLDFEYEIEDGGLPNRVVHGRLCAGRESPAHRDHPTLARRVRHLAAVSDRRRHAGRRLFALGRDDLLPAARLALSRNTSTICTPPICRSATSCCRTTRTRSASSSARACRMPAAPTASRAGRTSTSRRWPRRSARAAGANTVSRQCSNIARRTFATRPSCCGVSSPAIGIIAPDRSRSS